MRERLFEGFDSVFPCCQPLFYCLVFFGLFLILSFSELIVQRVILKSHVETYPASTVNATMSQALKYMNKQASHKDIEKDIAECHFHFPFEKVCYEVSTSIIPALRDLLW